MRRLEIARTRLSDHLVSHFARQIVSGAMKPGDQLDAEPELAIRFGVSKPIVRESLQGLAALGMVRVQQGKRTIILDDGAWDFLAPAVQEAFQLEGRAHALGAQLYEVRLIVEAASAEKAAERASPAQITELRRLIEAMREISAGSQNLEDFLRLDRAFHDLVAKASGNLALRQVVRNIHQFLSSAWSSATITVRELPHLTELHSAVAEAIAQADGPGARRAMEAHLAEAAAKQARRLDGQARRLDAHGRRPAAGEPDADPPAGPREHLERRAGEREDPR